MAQQEYAGVMVDVNESGYMTDLSQWTKEIAADIAKEVQIEMTDKHWEIIDYLQKCQKDGVTLSIRKVGKSGITDIKEFYALFPGGPLKKSTKIAGIPKPASCV